MILVTGFEPYNGSHVNPSSLVLAQLPDVVQGRMLRKVVLPCDSRQTPPHAKELASDPAIDGTVILGEDRRYALPTLERTAYNWLEYEVPDNSGHQPRHARIVEQGPSSITTSLDPEVLRQSLASQGVVIDVACDPGRHLCNHVYYTLLYHALRQAVPRTILLFHLPRLPEQHTYPNLPFEESFRATLALLEQFSFMEDNNGYN
jgi:pyroglutamyl-peptidase